MQLCTQSAHWKLVANGSITVSQEHTANRPSGPQKLFATARAEEGTQRRPFLGLHPGFTGPRAFCEAGLECQPCALGSG